MTDPITIRPCGADDADQLAAMHAASWASAYRGMMSDAYLDGPVVAERLAFWRKRYQAPGDLVVLMAERAGQPLGFISWVPDHDPVWGGLIDNFHMLPAFKQQGIGRLLFDAITATARDVRPGQPIYLWVLEANIAAQAAYAGLGGRAVEHTTKLEPDGQEARIIRIAWPAPAGAPVKPTP